ncbi:hypothetical protein Misp01_63620 [Microtetraspora sp. NBRC 13810]|uniref:MFS transporter n=1 Tax=Microtetraspora sp. NBRC 13810 TaxID=3030990 RepID=UPI0024A072F1|nr:MFS transporter [Microtetraspora sp. NBRC 13810]GLW11234.1 hypothetical protein Misp01_63620 [Microtetraspora sp. NBRC 13810]
MTSTLSPAPPASTGAASRPPRGAVTAAALTAFTALLAMSVTNPALPAVERDLAVQPAVSRWVVLGYGLAAVVAAPFAARWVARTGPRRAMLLGAAGFAASTVLCGLAPGIFVLLAGRVAQGGFAGLLAVLVPVLALRAVRPVTALSVTAVVGSLGALAGAAAGGGLLPAVGWRGLLLVLLPLVAVFAFLAARSLTPGTAVGSPAGIGGRVPAGPGGGVRPVLGLAVLVALATADGAMLALYPFFMFHGEMQQSALPALGLALGALPVAMVAAGVAGGRLADRRGPFPVMVAGALVAAAGALLTMPLTPDWSAGELGLRLLLTGAGMGLYGGAAQALALHAMTNPTTKTNTTTTTTTPGTTGTTGVTTVDRIGADGAAGVVARAAARVQVARGAGFVLGPLFAAALWAASGYFSRIGMGTALLACAAAMLLAAVASIPLRAGSSRTT